MPKKTPGLPVRLYFDAEANESLDLVAVEMDMPRSNVVCALVRVLSGKQIRTGEEKVLVKLKKIFGREHLRAFLRAVSEALGQSAEPVGKPASITEADFIPSMWRVKPSLAVVAFFHPCQENIGEIFNQSMTAKKLTGAKTVVIVSPSADVAPEVARSTLKDAGIHLVSVTHLKKEIKRLSK